MIPFANVDEAVVDDVFSISTDSPPENVDVPCPRATVIAPANVDVDVVVEIREPTVIADEVAVIDVPSNHTRLRDGIDEELVPPLAIDSAEDSDIPLLNVCRAVNVFAVYVFTIVVDAFIYAFTLVSPYVLFVIQVPFTEKQPAVRFTPLANVDDAVVDDVLSIPAVIPPTNVEVAVVVDSRDPIVILVPVADTVLPSAPYHANCPYVPADTTDAEFESIHTLLILKQPLVRFRPLANVDEAVVDDVFKIPALIPPVNVEVAVDVASTLPIVN